MMCQNKIIILTNYHKCSLLFQEHLNNKQMMENKIAFNSFSRSSYNFNPHSNRIKTINEKKANEDE
jgi:hypothetical protein